MGGPIVIDAASGLALLWVPDVLSQTRYLKGQKGIRLRKRPRAPSTKAFSPTRA